MNTITLKEGIEVQALVYLIDDSDGSKARVTFTLGVSPFEPAKFGTLDAGELAAEMFDAGSWRPMTRAEIEDYKRREGELEEEF